MGIAVMLILEPLNISYYGGLFLVFTAGYFMLHLHTSHAILHTSADGFLVIDALKKLTQVNDAYCRMSGYSKDELQQLSYNDIDAEVSATFLNSYGGQFVCFCRDITGRKQAEDRIKALLAGKELLLKEVHHRIKNNLSTISSLLALQAQSAPLEAGISFEDAINRVNSMVVLYDKLLFTEQYDSISCKVYLEDIIRTLMALFSAEVSVTVESRMDDFNLTPKKLFPLGIIVNEIITNIMKYAFNGRERGQIGISLVRVDNVATLSIQDNGVGLPMGFDMSTSTGFGLMLVGMQAEQLGGTFTMKSDSGTRNVLVFDI